MREKCRFRFELHGRIFSIAMLRKAPLVIFYLSTVPLFAQVAKEPAFTEALVQTRSPLVLANGSLMVACPVFCTK